MHVAREKQLCAFDKHELSFTNELLDWLWKGSMEPISQEGCALDPLVFNEESFADLALFD